MQLNFLTGEIICPKICPNLYVKAISIPFGNDIAFLDRRGRRSLQAYDLRRLGHLRLRRAEHILDENSVAGCRIVYHDVSHCSDQLAVLDNGRARHECVQVGTTVFTKISQR